MLAASLLLAAKPDAFDPGPSPMLMRQPTVSRTAIVFAFAGDLWTVPRAGGAATRLTSAPGIESNPRYSPDGATVAFTGTYDGNADVFTVPAAGGVPKRLTAHPDADGVVGWTPDGGAVLFASSMLSATDYPRLFTVPTAGGVPKPLPFPSALDGALSPDGTRLAYVPRGRTQQAWKRYRGGQQTPIWIGALKDSKVEPIPQGRANATFPMWAGDELYFLSDPRGPVGLSCYDVRSRRIREVVRGEGFDLKSASMGPGAIVVEKLGSIWLYSLGEKTFKRVDIDLKGDFPEVRPAFKALGRDLQGVSLSPSGARLAVAAHGLVFTVPAAKGDARAVAAGPDAHRRDPAWSPDGKTLAYMTDEGGSQCLELLDLATGASKRVPLGDPPAYYDRPFWSPDSKKIAYTDNRLTLWVLDLATGKSAKVDEGAYRGRSSFSPCWSPDSQWIAYSRDLDSHVDSIFLYGLASGKATRLTDGLAYAYTPVFDRDGRHLYFLASTKAGLAADFQDISAFNAPNVVHRVYAVVLRKDGESPLVPQSDEEGPKRPDPKPTPFRIDLDGIERRIVALPMPEDTYSDLKAGPPGSFFVRSVAPLANALSPSAPGSLQRFTLADRKAAPFAASVAGFDVSADGAKVLLVDPAPRIVPAAAPPAPDAGRVDLAGLTAKIDPRTEWRHMFHEVWRNERMLFHDPNLRGADADALDRRYAPFLDNVMSRADLNYLLADMLGELSVGHMFIGGGDLPAARGVPGGLLGADYAFENGRYRLTRVYDGERWNPTLYAPLAQPGVDARPGEYLLEIDGKPLTDAMDVYEALEGKAGRQVKVKIGPTPDGVGAREAIVLPVASEALLRFRAWGEDNRRTVERMSGGRVGYVHMPDTSAGGWEAFNRYYYAQSDKDGMVIDSRFNHGGSVTNYFIREMEKTVDFRSKTRYGKDWSFPPAGVYGPKAMITNELSGSGGDIFPMIWRIHKVGPLVGKRTWGGVMINYGFPLQDGGRVSVPDDALYDPEKGEYLAEGHGVDPTIDVELDPFLWRQGRDAQLERAVAEVMKGLAKPKKTIKRPKPVDASRVGIG